MHVRWFSPPEFQLNTEKCALTQVLLDRSPRVYMGATANYEWIDLCLFAYKRGGVVFGHNDFSAILAAFFRLITSLEPIHHDNFTYRTNEIPFTICHKALICARLRIVKSLMEMRSIFSFFVLLFFADIR